MISYLGELFLYSVFSFACAVLITPFFVSCLRKWKMGKNLREETVDGKLATIFNQLHAKKAGTPTMGGVMIWGTILFVVLFSRMLSYFGVIENSVLQRAEVYLPLFTLVFVGILGAIDDYFNVKGIGKKAGLPFLLRSLVLIFFALSGAAWFYFRLDYTYLSIPFLGVFDIGIWYIPLFVSVIFFTSNAVNVTDGLDGLAGGLLAMAFSVLIALAYFGEDPYLGIFCGVTVGALLAFLWHNVPPAKFYMGDTGAFALGATLGVIVMMNDTVFILPFIGFFFFLEAASVALQLFWKKFFKRKLFHIAPLHHHLEHIGWTESQIVMRAWILSAIFCILGLIIGILSFEEQQKHKTQTENTISKNEVMLSFQEKTLLRA